MAIHSIVLVGNTLEFTLMSVKLQTGSNKLYVLALVNFEYLKRAGRQARNESSLNIGTQVSSSVWAYLCAIVCHW